MSFSQDSNHEKHTIALNVSVDSLGSPISIAYVSDSSNIKGLEQSTIDKMLEIAQRKVKSMQFPGLKYGYKQLVRFDFITVNGSSTKEQGQ